MRTEVMYQTVADPIKGSQLSRDFFLEVIERRKITPHFQPIVDLISGDLLAYEVLARSVPPFEGPGNMFQWARKLGVQRELEKLCLETSLAGIAEVSNSLPNVLFSFNLGPRSFSDPDFRSALTAVELSGRGLEAKRLIIEFTETQPVDNRRHFERLVRKSIEEGFYVALDDFGSGFSGLQTLSTIEPHFLKLDQSMIVGIEHDPYKQNIVRAVASLAQNVGCGLVAEGIESEGQLFAVMRLGVRYGQGSLLGEPQAYPEASGGQTAAMLQRALDYFRYSHGARHRASISRMALVPPCFRQETVSCERVRAEFARNRTLDHVVVLAGEKPAGIITRYSLRSVGGKVPLASGKGSSEEIVIREFLSVNQTLDVRSATRMAMGRGLANLYDPIVVTGPDGCFTGTIRMNELFSAALDHEIEIATSLNPLTRLPGNIIIAHWLEEIFKLDRYAVIYADLSRFKEFNERYGFVAGDDLIRATARLFVEFLPELSPNAKLGHIGGDDFIVVSDRSPSGATLDALCTEFDSRRSCYFSPEENERAWYSSTDRSGRRVRVPLVTVTLAAVTSENFEGTPHPALISQIAMMLKRGDKLRGSHKAASQYLFERRRYVVSEGLQASTED